MMKKRFKLLSNMIPSFQSCKDDNTVIIPPVFCLSPLNPKRFDIDFPSTPPPPLPSPVNNNHNNRRRLPHAAIVASTALCRPRRSKLFVTADIYADDMPNPRETPAYLWRKEEKWHVVEEFQNEELQLHARTRRRRRTRTERKAKPRRSRTYISSNSSVDSGMFSSDNEREEDEEDEDEDETSTLMSPSRSFSTDSTEVEKVKESFAVVKKSEDPRGDFRRSMAEMVVEKGIYDAADLEKLLHCFLELNARQHHQAILSAFSDIWEALFPDSSL